MKRKVDQNDALTTDIVSDIATLLFARSYSVANQFISNTSLANYSTKNILLAAKYL